MEPGSKLLGIKVVWLSAKVGGKSREPI